MKILPGRSIVRMQSDRHGIDRRPVVGDRRDLIKATADITDPEGRAYHPRR
jgi:hypothetical protein